MNFIILVAFADNRRADAGREKCPCFLRPRPLLGEILVEISYKGCQTGKATNALLCGCYCWYYYYRGFDVLLLRRLENILRVLRSFKESRGISNNSIFSPVTSPGLLWILSSRPKSTDRLRSIYITFPARSSYSIFLSAIPSPRPNDSPARHSVACFARAILNKAPRKRVRRRLYTWTLRSSTIWA